MISSGFVKARRLDVAAGLVPDLVVGFHLVQVLQLGSRDRPAGAAAVAEQVRDLGLALGGPRVAADLTDGTTGETERQGGDRAHRKGGDTPT